LSLIRDFESKLLALEEQNAIAELQVDSAISVAFSRLSYLLRQLLRAQGGEDVDPPPSPIDEAAEREPWTAAQAADHALEREIELARLEKENEELRRMLGLLPAQPRRENIDHPFNDVRRTDSMHGHPANVQHMRPGHLMPAGFGGAYQRMHSPGPG
jgi:hypothetical protein